MQIVVATMPDSGFILGRDLALLKASTLYSDDTILFSPTYEFSKYYVDIETKHTLHQLVYLAILSRDPVFVVGEELTDEEKQKRIANAESNYKSIVIKATRYEAICSESTQSQADTDEKLEIEEFALKKSQAIATVFSGSTDIALRTREIERATNLGLVETKQVDHNDRLYYRRDKYISNVNSALLKSDTYAALDERFINLIPTSQGQQSKQKVAKIGAELFSKLPGFDSATFDEIADIKEELKTYLVNFRRGITEMSQSIKANPWDKDFANDVELELVSRLYPEVAAIEDAIKTNSYLKQILHKVTHSPLVVPATSALGMVLSTTLHTSAIAFQIATNTLGAGILASQAYTHWQEENKRIENNTFFFYYRARKLLDNL